MLTKDLAHQRYHLRVKMVPYHKSLEVHNNFFLLCCKEPMSLSYHFAGLLCRKQKDLSLSRPSSREDGSIAKVIRSQFLYPTPHPDKSFPTCYSSNKIVTSKVDWKKIYLVPIRCSDLYYRTKCAGEEYLAEEPLILPLPAGSRSPCHLWCLAGRIGPISPVASYRKFHTPLANPSWCLAAWKSMCDD